MERDPNHSYACLCKGEALARSRNPDAALEVFRKAVEIDADSELARRYYASTLLDTKKPKEALEQLQFLAKRLPSDSEISLNMARCYRRLGETEKAIELTD